MRDQTSTARQRQDKNEAHIFGDVAKDPVTRFTPTGKKISTLTVVTKHKQWSEFHRIVCWENAADKAEKLSKGDFVRIVGRLQSRSWQDKETGQKKYVTEVIAFQIAGEESETRPMTPDPHRTSPAKKEASDDLRW